MKNNSMDMSNGPLLKNIIVYTVPLILTGFLQLLFNAADLVVVGRFCGSISVGAVGATTALINLIVNLFIGLSVGAGVAVAHSIGAGQPEKTHRVIHTAIPGAFIGGIVLTVVGLIGSRYMLTLMGTPPDVLTLSALYMKIYFCGITATVLYNFGAAILRAAGDTRHPLIFLTISGVVNVLLNLLFVCVFQMDVAGVALATVISQVLSAALVLRALMLRTDSCKLVLRDMHIYAKQLLQIIRIGLPAGIQGSLFSISNVIIQSSVNSFDSEIIIAGNSAALSIEGFVYITMNSFAQTAVNFAGQNFGARKYDRITRIFRICLLCVTMMGIVSGGLAYIFARQLLGIYITDSAEAISYGMLRVAYICLPYFLCGLLDVTTGMIRGMDRSLVPMLITVLGVCGMRIGWVYTVFAMPQYHTLDSLYVSYPISWLLTFLAELICYFVIFAGVKKQDRLSRLLV